jgi:hypothetical protein
MKSAPEAAIFFTRASIYYAREIGEPIAANFFLAVFISHQYTKAAVK